MSKIDQSKIKKFILSTAVAAASLFGHSQSVIATPDNSPEVYLIFFTADWCGPCRIIEPKLTNVLKELNDPEVERIDIDISTQGNAELGAYAALDRGITDQFNQWMGVTGFAAIIDADTKQTLGCLTLSYDEEAMKTHISNLKNQAHKNQQTFDVTCPTHNILPVDSGE